MKKGWKVILIITSVCVALGLLFAGIGIGMGGTRTFLKWAEEGEFSFGSSTFVKIDDISLHSEYEVISGEGNRIALGADETISEMIIQVEGASVEIVRGNDDELRIGYENARKLQFFVENGTLYVLQQCDTLFLNEVPEITIYIPERLQIENVALTMGGGKIQVETIAAQNIHIEIGAGELIMETVSAQSADIEIGAGSAEIRDGQLEGLNVEVGMGSFEYKGRIRGSIAAECAMGSMDFTLTGAEMDYNYDIDCAMGAIKVDHREYKGIASERVIDNDAFWDCSLECSMGSITLRFR